MAASYPISAVAKLTGIPLDTLRAWERRYGTVIPKRDGRGRVYSEEQIQKLLLLRRALEQGHSIGQVAALGHRQLRQLLEKSSSIAAGQSVAKPNDSSGILSPVLHALDRFDYAGTDREINRLAAALGSPRNFVHQAALPLMRTVGERWHEGKCSIAQEHMLTNLLTAVLASLVRTYAPSNPPARVLLATPANERHAFPILAAAMDGVVDVKFAVEMSNLGGIAVLNLDGVQTRYENPDEVLEQIIVVGLHERRHTRD